MTDEPTIFTKLKEVVPHIPYCMCDKSHSHTYHFEDFVDKAGNRATLKAVKYVTKNNVEKEAVILVKWESA